MWKSRPEAGGFRSAGLPAAAGYVPLGQTTECEAETMLFSARNSAVWLRTAIVFAVAVVVSMPLVISR